MMALGGVIGAGPVRRIRWGNRGRGPGHRGVLPGRRSSGHLRHAHARGNVSGHACQRFLLGVRPARPRSPRGLCHRLAVLGSDRYRHRHGSHRRRRHPHSWVPAIATWVWILLCMVVVTVGNLATVGVFGEVEFWLAGIKIAAICLFLLLGTLAIFGCAAGTEPVGLDTSPDTAVFFPTATTVWPSACSPRSPRSPAWRLSPSPPPNRPTPRGRSPGGAHHSLADRGVLIGSMAVIVTLLPWNAAEVGQSPYVAVLHRTGIPAAGQIMNVVVFVRSTVGDERQPLQHLTHAVLLGWARTGAGIAFGDLTPPGALSQCLGLGRTGIRIGDC